MKVLSGLGIWAKLLALYFPPPTSFRNTYPAWLTRQLITPYPTSMSSDREPPHRHPGIQALAAAISRANTPPLPELPFPSPSNRPFSPLVFLVETFSETRKSLQLSSTPAKDLSPKALQTITASEGSILFILFATVSGIMAITTQLETVTNQLAELRKESSKLHTDLDNLCSKVVYESVTQDNC